MISVALDPRGGALVARVTLDNPAKLNCLSREALGQFAADMRALEHDPRIRAVVVTGAGEKAFTGGADLDALGGLNPLTARVFIGQIHEACAAVRDCPVPVIARINGWCLGGGLELAAACDLRIAADTAGFGMPEVRLGIPSVVEAALLPRLIGAGRAAWLVLTGEAIDARTALEWGLVEELAPDLDQGIEVLLERLKAADRSALSAQKRLLQLWEEAPLTRVVATSIGVFARSYASGRPNALMRKLRR